MRKSPPAMAAPKIKQETYEYEESEGSLRNKSAWDGFDEDCEIVGLGDVSPLTLQQQLEIEKKVYPGAKTWAPREELLFERLFMRQELAMLPAHWDVDFRDVPIGDAAFAVKGESEPIIYAYGKEFSATTALTKLIDLTSAVRTASQTGLVNRSSEVLKKGLERYLAWAAEDAGYNKLKVVPNIIAEIVSPELEEDAVTDYMQSRMRALARLQREFLHKDRRSDFWKLEPSTDPNDTPNKTPLSKKKLLLQKYLSPHGKRLAKRKRASNDDDSDDFAPQSEDSTPTKSGSNNRRVRRKLHHFSTEYDELATDQSSILSFQPTATQTMPTDSSRPETPKGKDITKGEMLEYRRQPPVVYGLFILGETAFVLTVDSARGESGYISFLCETDFMNKGQTIWNALTIAMVVCMARDDLRERMHDFEDATFEDDTDHDA
ncbi:hypothetical protein VHEMI04581 [[Torrubiella] hemipterigena]|uniref:Uncharacterized protein n=1 Tax=[Torrubiella] hemipterigena TaxID=1531966 RepID=A0A0A1TEU3_9HYPO|nr:hypothetical protein VHEMI04581 [[Torrubiella] hemipterigena]